MNPLTSNPIRIAFVGAGNMARLHLHALRRVRTPHRVVGVQDRDEGAARQFGTLAHALSYRTLDELFEDARPDLVHICTSAGSHYEPARQALLGGAHIYVEKPFVATLREADELLDLAAQRGLLVCAGHQQVRDPAYLALLDRAPDLGEVVQVDSHFTFRPVGTSSERAGATALAEQLVDILPHPLYTLVDALERLVPAAAAGAAAVEIGSVVAGARDLHAILRAGDRCYGRLSVSLRARPIASLLAISGTGGTLTADFLRSSVVGAANPGTSPVEKAANPMFEAAQLAVRNAAGVARRVLSGGDYPGLVELIDAFYAAVASGGASPVSPAHLRRVTTLFEDLAANVRGAAHAAVHRRPSPAIASAAAPLVVVTGARGFFGRAITKQLVQRGYRVRGISRSAELEDPNVHEWLPLDLSRSVPAEAFAGAEAVVHAAAASSGDYDTHQRHTLDATRNVLHSMRAAGVSRLVYVSSISVLRPPRTPWEEQNEQTPLTGAEDRQFGSYVWGKSGAERIVAAEAGALGIEAKTIRPGALVDWANLEPPGFMGRRLFGRWHLGFGRPGLPIPVCEVGRAAAVVAWTVAQFADAPPMLNLLDPAIATRRRLLEEFKRHGWRGHFVWVPLPLFVGLVHVARYALAAIKLRRPTPLALFGILRPRRYDTELSEQVLRDAMRQPQVATAESPHSRSLATTPA